MGRCEIKCKNKKNQRKRNRMKKIRRAARICLSDINVQKCVLLAGFFPVKNEMVPI